METQGRLKGSELLKLLRIQAEELEWQLEAVCNQTDPDAFFPAYPNQARRAMMVCAKCPVKKECYDYAIKNNEEYGVWGGVDFTYRRIGISQERAERRKQNAK